MDIFLDLLPPQVKFGVLVLCVFVFFCCHNYREHGQNHPSLRIRIEAESLD